MRLIDWHTIGIQPLQDHDPVVPLSIRQQMVGGRVAKMLDASELDTAESALVEIAKDSGLGTLGDIHPWLFWQTADRKRSRAMGSWSQTWGGITSGGGTGGTGGSGGGRGPVSGSSGFFDISSQILPKAGLGGNGGSTRSGGGSKVEDTTVLPLADRNANPDGRYIRKTPGWPKSFPAVPQGVEVVVAPGTTERVQSEVMLWADPRLFAVATEGPAEAGTLVVDLQPEAEPCMDGGEEPGMDGRAARLQSVFRVISRDKDENGGRPRVRLTDAADLNNRVPGDISPNLGGTFGPGIPDAKGGNVIALNFALSPLDKLPGYGIAWFKLEGTGGQTSTQQPNLIGNRTRKPGSGSGGNSPQGPDSFGEWKKKGEKGHGSAFLAALETWGPLHGGHDDDKHRVAKDRDGNPMNSAHIWTNALYYRTKDEDGPFLFEGAYPETRGGPLAAPTHLSWDEDLEHPWVRGTRKGYWRWWTSVPYMVPPVTPPEPPDEPPGGPGTPTRPGRPTTPGGPPPPPRLPRTPGTPSIPPTNTPGPTTPGEAPPPTNPRDPVEPPGLRYIYTERPGPTSGSGGLTFPTGPFPGLPSTPLDGVGETEPDGDVAVYCIMHPFAESFAEVRFRPQQWTQGNPNFAHRPSSTAEELRRDESTRPTVVTMHSWGSQSGQDGWNYERRPWYSRARGGTSSGGILFAPPHLAMEDYFEIGRTLDVADTETVSYVTCAPNVAFALGTPTTDGGLDVRSVVIAQDPAGANRALSIYQLDSSGTPASLISGSVSQTTGEVVVGIARGGNQSVRIPAGTTAQRTSSPVAGDIRFNSTLGQYEGHDGTSWGSLGSGSGATDFLGLADTPGAYTGAAGAVLVVNSTPDAVEFESPITTGPGSGGELVRTNGSGVIDSTLLPASSSTFVGLSDTPGAFAGSGSYLVRVNAGATALEFVNGSTIYQPLDAELSALAGLTSAADSLPYFTGSGTAALATLTAFARTLLDDADAATARTTLDAAQTSHTHAASDITSGTFADARIAASNVTQHEAALTITEAQISDLGAYAEAFVELADVPSSYAGSGGYIVRVNGGATALEFVDGSSVFQPLDAELTALAGLTSAADALPYFTGPSAASTTTLSAFGRTLIDDADAATARATLGAAASSHTHAASEITSGTFADARISASSVTQHQAALVILESQIPDGSILARRADAETITGVWGFDPNTASAEVTYFVNSGAGSHSIAADGGLGIVSGVNVGFLLSTPTATRTWTLPDTSGTVALTSDLSSYQPLDAELTALAGLTSAADRLPYFTGSGTAALATLTSFARSLLDDSDAATARTTLAAAASSHTHVEADITDLGAYLEASDSATITGTWTFDPNSAGAHETTFQNSGAGVHSLRIDGAFYFQGSWEGSLDVDTLTNDRAWLLPDSDGTLALASDVISTFLGLSDTPSAYTGGAGKVLSVNSTPNAVQFEAPTTTSSGVSDAGKLVRLDAGGHLDNSLITFPTADFTTAPDTPSSYAGNAGYFLRVNSTPDAVEFVKPASAGLVLTSGAVPLTAAWDAGAYNISTSVDPSSANHLTRLSYVQGNFVRTAPTTTGQNTVQSGAAAAVPLKLVANVSQTADLFQIVDALGTEVVDVNTVGVLRATAGDFAQASPPASPSEGWLIYDTGEDDAFGYDATKSGWLGFAWINVDAAINANGVTSAQYALGGPGNQSTQYRSTVLPFACKLVAVTSFVGGTVTNTDFIIRRNGSDIVTVNRTSADSGVTGTVTAANSDAFGVGDMLQVYIDPTPGGDSLNSVRVCVWFRRLTS